MSAYRIVLTKLAKPDTLQQLRWCIDFPVTEQKVALDLLTKDGVLFQGWLLHAPAGTQMYLLQSGIVQLYPLQLNRPDVIEQVLREPAEQHPQLGCGFRFSSVLQSADFELGIYFDEQRWPLVRGEITGEFMVLKGKDDWLFLNNDTNQSVEQHSGRLLLNSENKTAWRQYFKQSLAFSKKQNLPYCLLIAPSKEAVYPEFHPVPRAKVTAVDEMLKLVPADFPVLYPVTELKNAELRSFRLNDTHWSAFGGKTAAVALATKFGVSQVQLTEIFETDQYRARSSIGDLGNKLYPPHATEENFLVNFGCHKFILYDNGLANFGRALVLHNPTALVSGHCLMFASSSAYAMLDYLCRIFSQITVIHSAGNIDPLLCTLLEPDYLIAQTNARYVVRSPEFDYQVAEVMAEKLALLPPAERESLQKKAAERALGCDLAAVTVLQDYLQLAMQKCA